MSVTMSTSANQVNSHRVKECCVQLHSCVQQWQQLNKQGFDIASKLVNVILQCKYTQNKSSFGVFKAIKGLRGSVECKMIEERETLLMELHHIGAELAKLVERMGSLSSSLKAVAELTALTGQHLEQPLFQTLPVTQFGLYSQEIFQAYSQELSVKESIIGDILRQNDRDTLTVYLSCWLHQPYIDIHSNDKLETMLLECGLRT